MDIVALNQQIAQDLAVLQEQITFHEKRAASVKDQEWRSKVHQDTANKLRAISEHIVALQTSLQEQVSSKPPASEKQLSLSLDEIQGLPEALIKELSIDTEKTEFLITSLIDEAGGILSLDKILIGLYKRTGEIHKRTTLNNKIYRMVQRGELFSVPNKKGVYSTRSVRASNMRHTEEVTNQAEMGPA